MASSSRSSRLHHDTLLIVDFGSQYTQLLARRFREHGVYCEVVSSDHVSTALDSPKLKGIVLSGGPESVTVMHSPQIDSSIFECDLPLLGICYGMQAMISQLGGETRHSDKGEFGSANLSVHVDNPLLSHLAESFQVWMSHGDQVDSLPSDFTVSASTSTCPVAVCVSTDERRFGLQFHPEVTHTEHGSEILRRFAINICGCNPTWVPSQIIPEKISEMRQQVGSDEVILGLSGGVDSCVTAALLAKAIGKQLVCVFVDTGLLRHKERERVMQRLSNSEKFKLNIVTVKAEEKFHSVLDGLEDPEAKRKAIGKAFVEVFEKESAHHSDAQWLAQGTIYPDVIESAATESNKSHVIKSHHNVGGLPERLNLKLLEPIREFFKDEVRKIGAELGLPSEILNRHPFPGPGLAIRIPGVFRREYLQALRDADQIFLDELKDSGWYEQVNQAFVVFLPVRSVGVTGDARVHDNVVALRAVSTTDFMTAEWARLPYDLLAKIANRIVNEVKGISRVVYDVTSKPPATIEWE